MMVSSVSAFSPTGSSQAGLQDVTAAVNDGSDVRVTWSYDGVEPDGYEIHRSAVPLALDDVSASTLVTSAPAGTRSVVVEPATGESEAKFQYYYAVVWTADTQTDISQNVTPNPHGAARADDVRSCQVCHDLHDEPTGRASLGASGAQACYACHGMTETTRSYGIAASSDVQAGFYDETATPLPSGGSTHRNDHMVSTERECTACHTPHRRPFAILPEVGYPDLLRTGMPSAWLFSTQQAPLENDFCLGCHGADDTLMAEMGGAGAYDATAGDHESAYLASAHNPTEVPATDGAATQCQVCHAEHASPVAGLVDYRGSGTTGTGNAESGLCFKCHSAQAFKGVEADRGDGKPYTWNDRDVWSEFTSTSSHPYLSNGGGYAAKSRTEYSLESLAGFATTTLTDVVTWPGDEYNGYPDYAALRYSSGIVRDYDPLNLGYINGMNVNFNGSAFHTFDVGNIDSKGFDPPDTSATGSGSTSLNVGGKIYITQGESGGVGTTTRWEYTPPADSGTGVLVAASSTPVAIGTGADSDVDSVHGVAFYSAGEGSSEIMRWQHDTDTWPASIRFAVSGVETGLGIGSTIAYSPQADRLFVVNRNGTTGDGMLYYLDSPSTASGLTSFTSTGLQVTLSTTTARHNRMARVTVSGEDYIYIVGTSSANAGRTQLINDLDGTPALREAPAFPFTWGYYQMDDGSALEWDGASTLYAIQGGGRPDLSWRTIPADPVADSASYRSWNEWGYYNDSNSLPVGSSMAFAWTDPGPYTGSGYVGHGTILAPAFSLDSGVYRLGELGWTGANGSDSYVRFDLQGLSGGSWADVPGYTDLTPPSNLRDLDISGYDSFRVLVHLYSTLHNSSPAVYTVSVTSEYESFTDGGSLTCVNCHNTHLAEKGSGVWDLSRVADPDDTRASFSRTTTTFCLTCHDGDAPVATATASAFVPYSVSFSDMSGYTAFSGWDKMTPGAEFTASGHATTSGTKALCETCHDPHGSDNRSLLAWTRPASFPAGVAGERDNSSTAATGSNLCLQCHGNGTLGVKAPGTPDVATLITATYGHSVADYVGKHSDREGPLTSSSRHVECADCHDPHAAQAGTHTTGSSVAGDALLGATGVSPVWTGGNWTAATSYEATRITDAGDGYEAYVCLRCHAQSSMNLRFTTPADPTLGSSSTYSYYSTDLSREFNPANQSGHNIVGSRSSWPKEGPADGLAYSWPFPADSVAFRAGSGLTKDSQLTCTDCHTSDAGGAVGPHGSEYPFGLVADGVYDAASGTYKRWYETRLGEWDSEFLCGRCHNMNTNKAHQITANAAYSNHRYFTCASCHVAIPHGWQLPRLLREDKVVAADIAPYTRSNSHIIPSEGTTYVWSGDLDKFSNEAHTPAGWQSNDCAAYCHVRNARHEQPATIAMTPWSP